VTARSRLAWLVLAAVGIAVSVASRSDLGTVGTVALGIAALALAVAVIVLFRKDFLVGRREEES
jgi:hypothetical protein